MFSLHTVNILNKEKYKKKTSRTVVAAAGGTLAAVDGGLASSGVVAARLSTRHSHWRRVGPRATAVNSKTGGSRSASSLPSLAGSGLHGNL